MKEEHLILQVLIQECSQGLTSFSLVDLAKYSMMVTHTLETGKKLKQPLQIDDWLMKVPETLFQGGYIML